MAAEDTWPGWIGLTRLLKERGRVLRDDFYNVDIATAVSKAYSTWDRIPPGSMPPVGDIAILVFWAVFKPLYFYENDDAEVASDEIPFTDDLQSAFVDRLALVERWARFSDQPNDVPDRAEPLASARLSVSAHLAAARALALLRIHGADYEEVRDCLGRANHAASLLESAWGSDLTAQPFGSSIQAMRGVVGFELSRLAKREGRYAEALRRLAISLSCTRQALAEGWKESWWLGVEEWTANVRADHVASVISETLRDSRTNDWKHVASDCDTIRSAWMDLRELSESGPVDVPIQVDSASRNLVDYCLIARGQAVEKQSPSLLNDYLELREANAPEDRMRRYFFSGSLWADLPDKTRERLLTADRIWFSGQGEEAVLEELMVATLELCSEVIWGPLNESDCAQPGTESAELQEQLREKGPGHQPGLRHYVQICRMNCFSEFLAKLDLGSDQRDYLVRALPNSLYVLADFRDPAEHSRRIIERDAVGHVLSKFLGIGQAGVLPELAALKRRVLRHTDRKPPTLSEFSRGIVPDP